MLTLFYFSNYYNLRAAVFVYRFFWQTISLGLLFVLMFKIVT